MAPSVSGGRPSLWPHQLAASMPPWRTGGTSNFLRRLSPTAVWLTGLIPLAGPPLCPAGQDRSHARWGPGATPRRGGPAGRPGSRPPGTPSARRGGWGRRRPAGLGLSGPRGLGPQLAERGAIHGGEEMACGQPARAGGDEKEAALAGRAARAAFRAVGGRRWWERYHDVLPSLIVGRTSPGRGGLLQSPTRTSLMLGQDAKSPAGRAGKASRPWGQAPDGTVRGWSLFRACRACSPAGRARPRHRDALGVGLGACQPTPGVDLTAMQQALLGTGILPGWPVRRLLTRLDADPLRSRRPHQGPYVARLQTWGPARPAGSSFASDRLRGGRPSGPRASPRPHPGSNRRIPATSPPCRTSCCRP